MIKFKDIPCAPRDQKGMGMAAILATAVVMTLFAAGMLSTIMPVLQRSSNLKFAGTARSYAETGMDYAISQLNQGAQGVNCASQANASVTWTVPASVINDPLATVSVTVSTLPTANGNPPNSSILYDPLLNANYSYAYRMVTVTATYGSAVKQIRSLLEPIFPPHNGNNSALAIGMPYGLFGVASVVYAGKAGFNSYNTTDPRLGADGGTMGKISQVYGNGGLSRSIVEGGSHYEYPNPQSYYAKQFGIVGNVYGASPASTAPWMTMTGNVYSNGNNTAYFPVTGPSDISTSAYGNGSSSNPAHNVYGLDNGLMTGIPNGQAFPSTGASSSGQGQGFIPVNGSPPSWSGGLTAWNVAPGSDGVTYQQPSLPAVPTAPTGTFNLGSVSLNNATITFDDSIPAGQMMKNGKLQSLSTIGSVTNGSISLPPGNYSINSLSLSNNSSVTFTSTTQADISAGSQPPVSLFVQGTNNGSTVLSVDNTSSLNMSGISGNGMNTSGNLGLTNSHGQSPLASNQLSISPAGASGSIAETSGSASQLQLYYSGSSFNSNSSTFNSQILLSGNERMTIYAPNTGILIGSPSVSQYYGPSTLTKDSNFYGALVGGSIGVNSSYSSGGGAYVHYDGNLRPQGMSFINPWAQVSPFIPPGGTQLPAAQGFRAVTWQEAVVPNKSNPNNAQWTFGG